MYYLSSTAEYRTIANLFSLSISFVCSCINEVSSHCSKDKTKFITIPKGGEVNEVMRIYKDKWQFPTCAGAIDGTHLTIRPAARKGYGSIAHKAKPNGLLTRGP